MLKLPLCPYCSGEFLSPAVKESMKNKNEVCPHCGKTFRIAKKKKALLYAAAVLILLSCNLLFLQIKTINLLFLTAFAVIGIAAAHFLVPYTVRYKPLK